MTINYIVGDTREHTANIATGSVSLVACSPPFIMLRSYLPADHPDKDREIGSEPDPATFLDTLLGLTAEWGRVLAPWGSIAIELGDTYSGSGGAGGDCNEGGLRDGQGKAAGSASVGRTGRVGTDRDPQGFTGRSSHGAPGGSAWPRPKCLALVPQLYAASLAYGRNILTGEPSPAGQWLVRNVIVWHRPNPAVGALGDKYRPSTSYITVATRSPKRWFDLTAVRGEPSPNTHARTARGVDVRPTTGKAAERDGNFDTLATMHSTAGAPPLDTWFDQHDSDMHDTWTMTTQPSNLSHYAMWPAKLAERLILSMCPAQVCNALVCNSCRHTHDGLNSTTLDSFTLGQQGLSVAPAIQEELRHLRGLLRGSQPVDMQRQVPIQTVGAEAGGGARQLQGRTDQPQGLHPFVETGLPRVDCEGVHPGAPLRDGVSSGPDVGEVGTRAPHQRSEGRQPTGESVGRDEQDASRVSDMSELRTWILDSLTCPCGSHGFAVCGEPRRRNEVTTGLVDQRGRQVERVNWQSGMTTEKNGGGQLGAMSLKTTGGTTTTTTGWSSCSHIGYHDDDGAQYRPGVVLDPFAGTGTTLCVAELHGRDSIGIDIDARNRELLDRRMVEVKRNLFGTMPELPGQESLFDGLAS